MSVPEDNCIIKAVANPMDVRPLDKCSNDGKSYNETNGHDGKACDETIWTNSNSSRAYEETTEQTL